MDIGALPAGAGSAKDPTAMHNLMWLFFTQFNKIAGYNWDEVKKDRAS